MRRKGGDVAEATIANSLRAARGRRGWTREALAYHSGVSWSAIAQIESGRRSDVRLNSLSALARALEVSIDYLVGGGAATSPPLLSHRGLIYGSDSELLTASIPFLAEGIERSESILVVTTKRHIRLLRDALGDADQHVDFVESSQWYLSPHQALSRMRSYLKDRCEAGARWIRVIGEPVWAGRSRSEVGAWTRYESILNLSFASSPATIVCPYDARSVERRVVTGAQHTHPEIEDHGGVSLSSAYREPEDFLLSPVH
jgi:transcriptional regulator with XRE-family HTH domain